MKLYLAIDTTSKEVYAICAGVHECTEYDKKLTTLRDKWQDEFEWAWVDLDSGRDLEDGILKWEGKKLWE